MDGPAPKAAAERNIQKVVERYRATGAWSNYRRHLGKHEDIPGTPWMVCRVFPWPLLVFSSSGLLLRQLLPIPDIPRTGRGLSEVECLHAWGTFLARRVTDAGVGRFFSLAPPLAYRD